MIEALAGRMAGEQALAHSGCHCTSVRARRARTQAWRDFGMEWCFMCCAVPHRSCCSSCSRRKIASRGGRDVEHRLHISRFAKFTLAQLAQRQLPPMPSTGAPPGFCPKAGSAGHAGCCA